MVFKFDKFVLSKSGTNLSHNYYFCLKKASHPPNKVEPRRSLWVIIPKSFRRLNCHGWQRSWIMQWSHDSSWCTILAWSFEDEVHSIMSKNTWIRGIYCMKLSWLARNRSSERAMDKYKARLLHKGFKRKKDFDCFDTFTPAVKISSIRLLIALAPILLIIRWMSKSHLSTVI